MTAEVALINRVAVALAADSAMTLSGGVTDKIYNTADKIFELSPRTPIGMMIFSNLDFMGVPLDVAIKLFRDTSDLDSCGSIHDVAEKFFEFLSRGIGITDESEFQHVERVARSLFGFARSRFDHDLEKALVAKPSMKRLDAHSIFLDVVRRLTDVSHLQKPAAGFEDIGEGAMATKYASAFDRAARDVFGEFPFSEDDLVQIRALGAAQIRHDVYSPMRTGLVFAGYGNRDLFPSLIAFDTDGMFCGRIKRRQTNAVAIDSTTTSAEIVPFAQHEMADRFLYGIDPDFEDEIPQFLRAALRKVGDAMMEASNPKGKKKCEALKVTLDTAIKVTLREFRETAVPSLKAAFKRQIHAMVSFMPKQELANFAESMVNITSIKRKVSAEQESVGGPVDVAVISRSDGFIWVHRKHYFDRALNPRYFYRRFGGSSAD